MSATRSSTTGTSSTTLRAKGAVFVEELDEVPDDALVVFSAHGVPKAIPAEARRRNLLYADATCPLVSKVHRGVEQHYRRGRTVLLIGHSGHPEVVGTMGQLPKGAVILVETVEQAETLCVPDQSRLAYATQTTLSLRETESILEVLKQRFPAICGPRREDICYATTNRQRAVEAIAPKADLTLIIGAPNSSNSVRLVEVAKAAGCPAAALVQNAASMDWPLLEGVATVAISAGASAPEELVDQLIAGLPRAVRDRRAGGPGRPGGRLVQDARRSRCGTRRDRHGVLHAGPPSGERRAARPLRLSRWRSTRRSTRGRWRSSLRPMTLRRWSRSRASPRVSRTRTIAWSRNVSQYILTLYEKRVAPADLPFFLALMEHLAAAGVPCPTPIHGRDGKALRALCGRPAALVSFRDGVSPRRVEAGPLRRARRRLGETAPGRRGFPDGPAERALGRELAAAVRGRSRRRRRRSSRASRPRSRASSTTSSGIGPAICRAA